MDTPANDNADTWSSIGWQAELILNRLRQIQKMKDWLDQRPKQLEANVDGERNRNAGTSGNAERAEKLDKRDCDDAA